MLLACCVALVWKIHVRCDPQHSNLATRHCFVYGFSFHYPGHSWVMQALFVRWFCICNLHCALFVEKFVLVLFFAGAKSIHICGEVCLRVKCCVFRGPELPLRSKFVALFGFGPMALPEQSSCGLCGLPKPDPDAVPRSPHWSYGVKAGGQAKIAEGACLHCRFVVYKQMKIKFSVLKRIGNEADLQKALRDSRTRRMVVDSAAWSKHRSHVNSFMERRGSKVKELKKSATV